MLKAKLKFSTQLTITIILTLGPSISFQSLLAAWTAPSAPPPGGALPSVLNEGTDYQLKSGGLGIADSIVAGKYIIGHDVNFDIKQDTLDSSDTKRTRIGGGGDVQDNRGAYIEMLGNESVQAGATQAGNLNLYAGATGNVSVLVGNLGLGIVDPTEKLDVVGNIKASGSICGSSGCIGPASGGDITGVIAGSGLSGGGTTGDVTLRINAVSCPAGQSIRAINADGTVVCEVDDTGIAPAGVQGGHCDFATHVATWPALSCSNYLGTWSIGSCAAGWTLGRSDIWIGGDTGYYYVCIKD